MAWPVIEVEIKWNINNFKAVWNEAKILARDTKKELDRSLLMNLELNIANFQQKLEEARTKLRQAKKDWWETLELRVETNRLSSWLTEAKRQLNNYVNTGDTSLSRLQAKFDSIKQSIIGFWTIIWTAVVAWIWLAGKAILSLASNLEQAKISFTTMLWSAEKANILLQELSDFAKKTPFELVWIRENAKQLLAMWIASENLIPTMKMLWDVSAWLSVPLDRLALAYGQVLAKWRLQWWELKQFTEAWVPLLAELSKNLNKTTWEISQMIEAGKISATEVTKAFETMTWEGGKFANLMEKQSTTLAWLWSNVIDSITQLWESVWTKIIPLIKGGVTEMLNFLSKNWEEIWNILNIILSSVWSVMVSVINLASTVWNTINDLFVTLSENVQESWKKQIWVLWYLAAWVWALWVVFSFLIDVVKWVFNVAIGIFQDLFDNIKVFWENTLSLFKNLWINIWRAFDNLPSALIQALKISLKALWNFIDSVSLWLWWLISEKLWIWKIVDNLDSWFKKSSFVDMSSWFKKLPWFVNTSRASIVSLSDTLTNAENNFTKLAENIDNLWSKTVKLPQVDFTNLKIDYSKILNTDKTTWWAGWWKWKSAESIAKEQAKQILDIKIKSLEDEARLNIQSVKNSELSEEQKAKAIVAINEKLQKDIAIIKWEDLKVEQQNAEEIIKIAEEKEKARVKSVESFYNEIDKRIKSSEDKVKNYQEEVSKINDEFRKMRDEAISNIKDINRQLDELETQTAENIAERVVSAQAESGNIEVEIKDLSEWWTSQSLAEALGKETLLWMQKAWTETIWTSTVTDMLQILDLLEQQKKLQDEIALATQNVSQATIDEAKRVSELSETQRLLEEQANNKAILDERKRINEDLLKWIELNLDEIKNVENRDFAEKLIAKQEELANELQVQENYLEQEKNIIIAMAEEKRRIETEYSAFFKWEINNRIADVQRLASEVRAVNAEIQSLQSWKVVNNTTTNNTTTNVGSVNNGMDLDSLLRALFKNQ